MKYFSKYPTLVAVCIIVCVTVFAWIISETEIEAMATAGLIFGIFALLDVYKLRARFEYMSRSHDTVHSCCCNTTKDIDTQNPLSNHNTDQTELKEERKKQILEFLDEHSEVDNDFIERQLDVSHATASRYLTELENEGKIHANADSGRHVVYTK